MLVQTLDKVPPNIKGRVCTKWHSDEYHGTHPLAKEMMERVSNRPGIIPLCITCSRPPIWYLYRCDFCSSFFFMDFISTHGHPSKHSCWECSSKLPICFYNKNVGPSIAMWEFFDWKEHPPIGIMGSKFSKEELADFDPFAPF